MARAYAVITQVERAKPPSSPAIVGSAVATMVPSIELMTWPSWSPTKTSRVRRKVSWRISGRPSSFARFALAPAWRENAFYSVDHDEWRGGSRGVEQVLASARAEANR